MKFETIVHTLAYWAEQTPDKTALIEAETARSCSYAELWRWSVSFSHKLAEMGVRRDFDEYGSRVVVRVGGFIETIVAQFAVYLAGGVYCPVEKHMKAAKLLEMLGYYDASVYISTEKTDNDALWFDLGDIFDDDMPAGEIEFPKPEDLCVIVFTTGTTGMAKGVMHNHSSMLSCCSMWNEAFQMDGNDICSFVMPVDRIGGLRWPLTCISTNSTLVYYGGGLIFLKDYVKAIQTYHVNFPFFLVTELSFLFKSVRQGESLQLDGLSKMIVGGGAIHPAMKESILSAAPHATVYAHYGATEVTAIASFEINKFEKAANCVGRACGNTQIEFYKDSERLQKTSKREFGALRVKNGSVMSGYWKSLDLTAGCLIDGYVAMADIGWSDHDGYVYLLGRADDVINSGGHKIAPYELETVAMQFPGVDECVCVGATDGLLGEIPILCIKMHTNAEFNAKAIFNFLTEHMESFKLPRRIIEVDEFPRVGGSSKINRKELKHYV